MFKDIQTEYAHTAKGTRYKGAPVSCLKFEPSRV